jgi:hypothetical protein
MALRTIAVSLSSGERSTSRSAPGPPRRSVATSETREPLRQIGQHLHVPL